MKLEKLKKKPKDNAMVWISNSGKSFKIKYFPGGKKIMDSSTPTSYNDYCDDGLRCYEKFLPTFCCCFLLTCSKFKFFFLKSCDLSRWLYDCVFIRIIIVDSSLFHRIISCCCFFFANLNFIFTLNVSLLFQITENIPFNWIVVKLWVIENEIVL